jgi:chitinase domain-containing protein 1
MAHVARTNRPLARGAAARGAPVRAARRAEPGAAAASLLASLLAAAPAIAAEPMTFDASATPAAAAYAAATGGGAKAAAAVAGAAAAAGAGSGLLDAVSDNPLLVVGGIAGLAVPAALISLLGGGDKGPAKAKPLPAAAALDVLTSADAALLLDVRSRAAAKAQGAPVLPKGVKVLSLPFTAIDKEGDAVIDDKFAAKYEKLRLSEEATVVLFDSEGTEAPAAAAALAAAGADPLPRAYVADGAEGPRGWKAAGGPWKAPRKGFSISIPRLGNVGAAVDSLAEDFKAAPSAAKAGLAGAAIVGAAALIFQEAELVLELAGVVAAARFAAGRLLAPGGAKAAKAELREMVEERVGGAKPAAAAAKPAAPAPAPVAAPVVAAAAAPAAPAAAAAAPAEAEAAPAAADGAPTTEEAAAAAAEAKEWVDKWRAKQA